MRELLVPRRWQGVYLHHRVFADDALRGAINATAGLRSVVKRTGDPADIALLDRAQALAKEISQRATKAQAALDALPQEVVVECREGRRAWPGEVIGPDD